MYVHNFYADLLLAIRVMYDNHIFENPLYIKRYEFNIGNRTFQLPYDLKPNFVFPNMIVTLNDENPVFGQKPEVSQMIKGWNIDQVPVLYNSTNGTVINLQEEMVLVPITTIINCESQFQAKEIANVIKRWLPYNKFIQFLEFTSFLEVSDDFLSRIDFNPNLHQIYNIFQKIDKHSGLLEYCFAVNYKPFIRMESISTTIPDSTQRSYQVTVELNFMIQAPLYLYSDKASDPIERISFTYNITSGFEPISTLAASKFLLNNNDITGAKGYVTKRFLFYEDSSSKDNKLLNMLTIPKGQVEAKSSDNTIYAYKGVDDNLYIQISDKKYKTALSNLSSEPVEIPINENDTLSAVKINEDDIIIYLYQKRIIFPVKIHPDDFTITDVFTYNVVATAKTGEKVTKFDYKNFVVDNDTNTVSFSFLESDWSSWYIPSLIHPLSIQFYDKDAEATSVFKINLSDIQNIKVINIQANTATITWATIPLTTSCIEYGLTNKYGMFSNILEKPTIAHRISLYGLTSNTLYHYRVNVIDENGTNYTSPDMTFTTLQE